MGQQAKSMPLLGEMLHEVVGRLELVERVQLAVNLKHTITQKNTKEVNHGAAKKVHAPPGRDAARGRGPTRTGRACAARS
jgi:hypothetical protein